jgi:AraC-like DNA-binding protein
LVTVIDLSKVKPIKHIRKFLGIYIIFLKDVKCGDIKYGKQTYDYQDGTLLFVAPGQIIDIENSGEYFQPNGKALVFHPDLIHGTVLGQRIREYTFFTYESSEALHISDEERQIILDCLFKIEFELKRTIDKHSKMLIISNLELLLNYSIRFYDRQFVTRSHVNHDILTKFETLLKDYFYSDKPHKIGLPTVKYFADLVNLSAGYFGDLIKRESGKTAQEQIQSVLINIAKEKILEPGKSASDVAYELGFKHPQHFSRIFKNSTGYE